MINSNKEILIDLWWSDLILIRIQIIIKGIMNITYLGDMIDAFKKV